jgi:uncharacterized protein (DUF1015 family)
MAEVIPFRGLLYDPSRVSIQDVLAPPYDVITPEHRELLYRQSPHNIVRIDFGREEPGDDETENRYTRARRNFDDWIKDGVLTRSTEPSFYAYEITYTLHKVQRRLAGFLCLVRLEELGKGSIYPHECTHSGPKQDRLNLLRACRANTSPIFSLYRGRAAHGTSDILSRVTRDRPYLQASDHAGNLHRLWQVHRIEEIKIMREELAGRAVLIADGHHRYETSFEFKKEMQAKNRFGLNAQPYDYTLMFLADLQGEGITILPTHRLIREIPDSLLEMLSDDFKIETVEEDFDIRARLSGRRNVFGFFRKGEKAWRLLTYRGGNLPGVHPDLEEIDVIILHEMIFKRVLPNADIGYEMDITKALDQVNQGEYAAAFFLNPTRVEEIEKAAISSTRMPPKSTYFYPKLLTGLVLNQWE